MAQKLIILVGMPGCGKSTYAADLGLPIVSSDAIRETYFGAYDQSNNAAVFSIFHATIAALLRNGISCVADSTALTFNSRDTLYRLAWDHSAKIDVVVFDNVQQAIERNQERVGGARVPDDAMERMILRMNITRPSIHKEAWHNLIIIKEVFNNE